MQCPRCQFENVDGSKFCNECGCKLEISCPECSKINQPGSKFCNECGNNLTAPQEPTVKELSFDEKIDKIQRYLPKGLTEKILSQRSRIEGERKQVTVMFCDMEGFTSLSEKLGPEEAYDIVDQIYELLIHKVHDYEGTVNEMTGDGIVALFGAPIALEDASQRALRSAMAIHREMSRFLGASWAKLARRYSGGHKRRSFTATSIKNMLYRIYTKIRLYDRDYTNVPMHIRIDDSGRDSKKDSI